MSDEGWGEWTIEKLEALQKYLNGFANAAKKARGTLYFDLFAGSPENVRRATGEPMEGSSILALKTSPPLTRMVFCELDQQKAAELRTLHTQFPERDIVVLAGDCNATIPKYLDHLRRKEPAWRRAPSFAFIDQFAAEVHWETLEALSQFRVSPPGKPRRKTELWLYFGESFIPRGSYGDELSFRHPEFASRVTRMFGSEDWLKLRTLRMRNQIAGSDYTAELTNYMRWLLETKLGYAITIPLKIRNEHGGFIYTMIFATDDAAGRSIMKSVSSNAAKAIDEMVRRSQAAEKARKEAANGIDSLFAVEPYYRTGDAMSSERSFNELMEGPAVRSYWLD